MDHRPRIGLQMVLTDFLVAVRARKRLVAFTVIFTLALQGLAMLVASGPWRAVFGQMGHLLEVAAREDHPAVADVLPLASPIAAGLLQILGVSLIAWMLAFLVGSRLLARSGFARAGEPGRGLAVSLLAVMNALSVAFLVGALAMMGAPATTFHVRGSAITVVPPTLLAGALMLATFGAALVTSALFMRVHTPGQAPAPEQPIAPATVSLPWGVAVVLMITVLCLAAAVAVHSFSAAPIADDYKFFARVREAGFLAYLGQFLTIETGRYAMASLSWLGFTIAGTDVVRWSPALSVSLIAVGWAMALRVSIRGPRRITWLTAGLAGAMISLVTYVTVPSIVDSYLWWSSTIVYLPPIGVGLITYAVARQSFSVTSRGARIGMRAVALGLLIVTQGFIESITLMVIMACFGVLVALWPRHPSDRAFLVAICLASLLGLAFDLFAPAQATRMGATGAGNLLIGALGSLYSNLQLWQGIGLGSWLLLLGAAMALATLLHDHCTPVQLLELGLVGGFLMVFPPALTGFISFYSLNWGPWRTYSGTAAFFAVGILLLLASFCCWRPSSRWASRSEYFGPRPPSCPSPCLARHPFSCWPLEWFPSGGRRSRAAL